MTKKNKKGSGSLFSGELGEVIGRLKRKEPELSEVVSRDTETQREDATPMTGHRVDDESIIETVTEIARRVAEETTRTILAQTAQTGIVAWDDLPPKPGIEIGERKGGKLKTGRKEKRDYKYMGITIDRVLYEMVNAEADKRGLPVARIVEAAVWNRYGRPRLSYQENLDSQGEQEGKYKD